MDDVLVSGVLANFADLSFARTVLEAFLKPIAGTLTIQSGRYLLLNAGGTMAEIPHKGLNVKGMQIQEGKNNDEMKKLAHTIHLIHNKSEEWIETLKGKYDEVHGKIVAVNNYTTDFGAHMTTPNYLNPVGHVWNHLDKEYEKKELTFNRPILRDSANEYLSRINQLRAALKDIYDYCDSLMKADDKLLVANSHQQFLLKELKNAIKQTGIWNELFISQITNKGLTIFNERDDWNKLKIILRRALIYQLIDSTKILAQKTAAGGTIYAFNDVAHCTRDNDWEKYIGQLKKNEDKEYWLDAMFSKMGDNAKKELTKDLPVLGWRLKADRDLWDTSKQGEILMSDKDGTETISIVNGAITRTINGHDYQKDIIDKLKVL